MEIALFTADGVQLLVRLVHYFAGVVWIGLLYYFNFVQGEYFKETDPAAKTAAIQKLVPRALKWFRHGALWTFLSGAYILSYKGHSAGDMGIYASTSWGVFILTGAALATVMFLNVWFVIWPNQKVVIAAASGTPNPNAAACAAKAGLASRSNVLFSIPMLFFMGAASHLPVVIDPEYSGWTLFAVVAAIIGALEFNALKGKLGPLTTVRGVIHCGVALLVVLYAVVEILT